MFDRVPECLRSLRQWLLWKTIVRNGEPTKAPFQANGASAKSNDPKTWTDFETAVSRWSIGVWDGIGFVFTPEDRFVGVDLDRCRNPETGEVADWAKAIILGFASYAEVSPSQTGVKIWCRGTWGAGKRISIPGGGSIEVYDRGRYFCVTGKQLQGCGEIRDCQPQLDALREQFWPAATTSDEFRSESAVVERARKYLAKIPGAVSGQRGHDRTFHAACVICLGFDLPRSIALGLIREWNVTCVPPWSDHELEHKIDNALEKDDSRGYLRNVQPHNWHTVKVPQYRSPQKQILRITDLEAAARQYVEKVRSGGDILLDTGIPDLDYAIGGGAAPGELFLLAARTSHGKSAVALQMVHWWTAQGNASLFVSEEMSALSLGKRTVQFSTEVPEGRWPEQADTLDEDLTNHFSGRASCFIVENCRTAEAAANSIRSAVADRGVKCAVVDYAQLLQAEGKSRYEQISNTSVCLRQVASETNVLLVALCQLNRQIEGRRKFIPMLSDLRDSGQLEQDADVIVFGVWPWKISERNDQNDYQFWVAKNRNRAINQGMVKANFNPARQMFSAEKPKGRCYTWRPGVKIEP